MKLLITALCSFFIVISCTAQNKKHGYAILKDSTKVEGKIKYWSDQDFLKIDGKKYKISNVSSFEFRGTPYIVVDNIVYSAWLVGKVSVYARHIVEPKLAKDRNFSYGILTNSIQITPFFRKDNGKLIDFTSKCLLELINDNVKAVEVFNRYFPKVTDKEAAPKDYDRIIKVLKFYDPTAIEYE